MGNADQAADVVVINSLKAPASDDALVDALLAFVNGSTVTLLSQPSLDISIVEKIVNPKQPDQFRATTKSSLRLALEEPHRFYREFIQIGLRCLGSLHLRPHASPADHGYTLGFFMEFPDVENMLTYGLVLVMDSTKPYGASLSRCKLPSCGNFYLARKQKAGGRPNRTYCCPEHRNEHHNSSDRKEDQMVAEHFIDIATKAFPKGASVARADQHGDLCLIIDWKLGTDPQRPNKRSQSIELRISREAIEDYKEGNEGRRGRADLRLKQLLTENLRQFNPEHNAPAVVVPPRVKWIIGTGMINV